MSKRQADRTKRQRSFTIISEHPLFVPSRRPWAPASPSASHVSSPRPVPPPARLDGYSLKGVTISSRGHFALVWSQATRANIRLVPKQSLDGWQLVTIDASGLSFVNDGRTSRLTFPGFSGGLSGPGRPTPILQSSLPQIGASAR